MSFKHYREESRKDWGRTTEDTIVNEEVKLGALLRIADAVETMAKSYDGMRIDRDWWKGQAEQRQEEVKRLRHIIRGLRGALFEYGHMLNPPCFVCGYHGKGYFQSETHPCAARHHALYKR